MLRHVLAVIGYWSGLDALFYWFNRRAKRIITFHNVLPDEVFDKAPCVGPTIRLSEFSRIVGMMHRRFGFSVDVTDASTCMITFDDGMKNEIAVAGEHLMSQKIPAVLFAAGEAVDAAAANSLVIDQLLLWCKCAPDAAIAEFKVPRRRLWWDVIQPMYEKDGAERGRSALNKLNAIYPVEKILSELPSDWVQLRMSGVTRADIERVRRAGWLVGWHTRSHYPLGRLNEAEKREELTAPSDMQNTIMSYPYGMCPAVDARDVQIAAEKGFPFACSNDPNYSEMRGRHFLMRMTLSADKYELHFVLSGLKYFLQCRKLLPRI